MTEIIPIETLALAQAARVVELVGPSSWNHRLEELGLRPGAHVRLLRHGLPWILAIGERRLSLRPEPGTMILVEPVTQAAVAGV